MTEVRIGNRATTAVASLVTAALMAGCGPANSPGKLAFGALCPSGQTTPAGIERSGSLPVGAQFHGTWTDYSDAERRKVLDNLVAGGVSAVRIDAGWRSLQPHDATHWDKSYLHLLDDSIAMAADRGMYVLVTLLDSPQWAGGGTDGRALPADPLDYAHAIGWLAARYAGRVGAWEVWNEPNSNAFARGSDPVTYVRLLQAAYPAVKAGDSKSLVLFAGTEYNDADFVAAAYAAGARGSFDVLATHPYESPSNRPPTPTDDGSSFSLGHVRAVREAMVAAGDGSRPIWFTEFGWSSHRNAPTDPGYALGVSLSHQAEYLLLLLRTTERLGYVQRVFWYTDRDMSGLGAQEGNYGLVDERLEPKPVLKALACYATGTARP